MAKKKAKVSKICKKCKGGLLFWIGLLAVLVFSVLASLEFAIAQSKWVFLGFLIVGLSLGILKKKAKKIHDMELSVIVLVLLLNIIPTLLEAIGATISGFIMNLLYYFLILVGSAVIFLSVKNLFVFFKKK